MCITIYESYLAGVLFGISAMKSIWWIIIGSYKANVQLLLLITHHFMDIRDDCQTDKLNYTAKFNSKNVQTSWENYNIYYLKHRLALGLV